MNKGIIGKGRNERDEVKDEGTRMAGVGVEFF